jgi:phosphate transport system permease protein
MARDPDGEQRLKQIRTFQMGTAPIVQIDAEERRKGFIALDAPASSACSTAPRTAPCWWSRWSKAGHPGLSPRANRMIIEAGGKLLP